MQLIFVKVPEEYNLKRFQEKLSSLNYISTVHKKRLESEWLGTYWYLRKVSSADVFSTENLG